MSEESITFPSKFVSTHDVSYEHSSVVNSKRKITSSGDSQKFVGEVVERKFDIVGELLGELYFDGESDIMEDGDVDEDDLRLLKFDDAFRAEN